MGNLAPGKQGWRVQLALHHSSEESTKCVHVCVCVYRPQAGGLFSCSLYFVVPAQLVIQHPRIFLKCLAMMFLAKQDLERKRSKVQRVCQAQFLFFKKLIVPDGLAMN